MQTLKDIFRKQLAAEFLRVRKEKGLSLSDVALQTNLSLDALKNIENNKSSYKQNKYTNLARFYDKRIKITLE